ncbi:MAG: putative 2-aminoethylphosphonate ABC transporter permease subunit [Pseudomonadota bacterium]|jgi:iron(III) transport system permease protein
MIGERTAANLIALAFLVLFAAFLVAPLGVLGAQALHVGPGEAPLANFARYLAAPGLLRALVNTGGLALAVTAAVLPLAFLMAYALERTNLKLKGLLAALSSAPLLVPSLLPALALVYLFGAKGLLTPVFGGKTIYGAQGVFLADAVAFFPHAVVLLRTALSAADGRLYEQAEILGAGTWRTFWRVTLPGARHGLVAAAVVVFSLVIADVGAPKVVGGDFDVLALEIYKQVLGQQNFPLGAVASLFILAPSLIAVVIERAAARRQAALVSSKSQPYRPRPDLKRDLAIGAGAFSLAALIVGVIAVCQLAAVVRLWPYDLSFSLQHYDFDQFDGGGWSAVTNSIVLGLSVAGIGVALAFLGAYVSERTPASAPLRLALSSLALLPAGVPGLALGLSYALAFNDPANPLHVIYGTFGILIVVTVIHFYAVPHLSSVSALKALDREFEPAGAVLGRSRFVVLARVLAPLSAPALVEIAAYLFVNAMTTVSAVVFLYPPDVKLASVAVLNMDDAGDIAPAAAMGMMIFYVNLAARLIAVGVGAVLRGPRA